MNFDFQYQERQAEIGFDWGSMVSVMELQLLGGTRNRMLAPQGQDVNNKKWNPNNKKTKNELCRNFANHGNVCMVTTANLNIYVRVQIVLDLTLLNLIRAFCLHQLKQHLNVLNIIAHIDM